MTLYRHSLEFFGIHAQIEKLLEEFAECQQALLHHKHGKDTLEHVHEELADVQIVLEQIIVHFGTDTVDAWKQTKLARLAERTGFNEL